MDLPNTEYARETLVQYGMLSLESTCTSGSSSDTGTRRRSYKHQYHPELLVNVSASLLTKTSCEVLACVSADHSVVKRVLQEQSHSMEHIQNASVGSNCYIRRQGRTYEVPDDT